MQDRLLPAQVGQFRWIDIVGLENDAEISKLAQDLGLSDLSIADLFHLDQRPHTDIDGDLVQTLPGICALHLVGLFERHH